MNLDKLGTLKKRLIAEDDLKQIWDYFSKHFDNEEFMKLGRDLAVEDNELHDLVEAVGAIALRGEGVVVDQPAVSRIVQIPEENLSHGVAMLQGNLMRFFYFEDLDVGMLFVAMTGGEFTVARLTRRSLPIR
jgi:hypothetical protein